MEPLDKDIVGLVKPIPYKEITLRNLNSGVIFQINLDEDLELDNLYISDSDDEDERWKLGESSKSENKPVNLYTPPSNSQPDESLTKLTPDSGVRKIIFHKGTGVKPPAGAKIFYEYVAFARGNDSPFDSRTGRRSEEIILHPNNDGLIPGLWISLLSMELQEQAQFWIDYKYAFGELGCPPRIPGKRMVIFNIRLNKFLTQEQLTDVSLLTHAERNIVEFGKILEAAKGIRQNANRIYGTHSYRKAIRMYRRAIDMVEDHSNIKDDEAEVRGKFLASCYSNIAQCFVKLERGPQACNACKNGLNQPGNNYRDKLMFRFAKAKFILRAFGDALKYVEQARQAGGSLIDCELLEGQIREEMKISESRREAMARISKWK